MSTKINLLNNKKILTIFIICLIIILMPIIVTLIKIIFAYGKFFGSYARYIIEGKICLG